MLKINDKLYFEYEKIMLENGMPQDLIFKTFKELAETNMFFNHQQQLQAYKDKEDRLIAYLEEWKTQVFADVKEDLLKIINEGDK